MAADPVNTESIVALHAHGTTLMLKGRPLKELPREVLPCFKQSIIDLSDDRRVGQVGAVAAPAGVSRNIAHVLAGIHSVADMEGAFDRGAVAVLGWPIGDEVTERPKSSREKSTPIDLQTVVELDEPGRPGRTRWKRSRTPSSGIPRWDSRCCATSIRRLSACRSRSVRSATRSCCSATSASSAGLRCCWRPPARSRT